MSPAETDEALQSGVRLLERFRVATADAVPIMDLLAAAYRSPERHYHNLEHLDEMFRIVGRLAGITDDLRFVHLAIWFHDAVYDSRAKDNETRSADLAVKLLGPAGVPRSDLEKLVRLIEATAHLTNPRPPADRESMLLVDADLAILGAPSMRYREYAAAIREEYAWVPDAEYRAGRSAVLRQFQARPRLFWTDALHAECDEQARMNLRWELAGLADA
jgi:predicted metal-dependent HD superfamily phosphohydrolase